MRIKVETNPIAITTEIIDIGIILAFELRLINQSIITPDAMQNNPNIGIKLKRIYVRNKETENNQKWNYPYN